MPKASTSSASLPISGLFGLNKPSGPTSMHIVNQLKIVMSRSPLFFEPEKVEAGKGKQKGRKRRGKDMLKIGQGGTLDPLADGVLVIGVGKATKKLNDFLDCAKEYTATCLLGCETDSYDSEGVRVRTAPWRHVTREAVEQTLSQFTGEIEQTPPIFSALKMDGMPLYDYARKGIPLPRPIEKRKITVHSLELIEWKGQDHPYRWPEKKFTGEQQKALEKMLSGVKKEVKVEDQGEDVGENEVPNAFVLKMKVSGGTYVRSIVHDLGHALGSAGHVVTLTRLRQKNYVLDGATPEEGDHKCVEWEIIEKALDDEGERDADGRTLWEREVLDKIAVVEG